MISNSPTPPPVRPGTGASVLVYSNHKVLLIKRGKEPYTGHWSLPGGGQELGEALETTAYRELLEETGLLAGSLKFMCVKDRITRDSQGEITHHYVLATYLCTEFSGVPKAGDDAKDIGWFSYPEMLALKTTPETVSLLANLLGEGFTNA